MYLVSYKGISSLTKVFHLKQRYHISHQGTTVSTNQFAVTEHSRDVSPIFGNQPQGMPGVFFNFEISPMKIKITESRKPFTHFLTDLCAIVGGVFTVAGIIDGVLFTAQKQMEKKTEIGKHS
jgi:endoplasmic reticulum-Golgi intermediate compartment protein 3